MPPAVAGGDPAVRSWEVTAEAAALLAVLYPHLAGLEVSRLADTGEAVVIFAAIRGAQARCPRCGQLSSRVHGRYQRLLADGAAGGRGGRRTAAADRAVGAAVPLRGFGVPGGHVR
jgi:hypothetical protein